MFQFLWDMIRYPFDPKKETNKFSLFLTMVFLSLIHISSDGAIGALGVLDSADYLMFEDTLDLRHYFSFDGYPFKSYWLDTENSALQWARDTTLYMIPESLKSHPDCDVRIQRIGELAATDSEQIIVVADEAMVMEKLKDVFQFESLEGQLMACLLYTSRCV